MSTWWRAISGISLYGTATGYRRDAGNDRVFHNGSAILDLSANDIISVSVYRISSNNPTTHFLEANRSSIQIIRLDDSTDFFRALSTDTTDITGITEHQVTWNTEHEKDSSYTHSANSICALWGGSNVPPNNPIFFISLIFNRTQISLITQIFILLYYKTLSSSY